MANLRAQWIGKLPTGKMCVCVYHDFTSDDDQFSSEVLYLLQAFPDLLHERKVLGLKVKCENSSKGCKWSGELRELEVNFMHNYTVIVRSYNALGVGSCNDKRCAPVRFCRGRVSIQCFGMPREGDYGQSGNLSLRCI